MELKQSFHDSLFLAIAYSLVAVIAGLFVSYELNLASGGTIVVFSLLLFLLTLIFRPKSKA